MTTSRKPAPKRSRARSAARLAAVQALYQQEMEGTPTPLLLNEFHNHRFGETIDEVTMIDAEMDFFDDLVRGVTARAEEIDGKITARLAEGWKLDRLDRSMRAILRAGTYELIARPDVTVGTVIDEYLDIAHAFFGEKDVKFVNGLLDKVAGDVRA
jgi:N utilization substance protein B